MDDFVVKMGRPPIYTKEERILRDKENHKRRRLALQAEVTAYKHTIGCAVCGTKIGDLEFHHPDGIKTKYDRIANIQTRRVFEELKKVQVLCKSCHLRFHNETRLRGTDGRFHSA